jgi:hypothetical protein
LEAEESASVEVKKGIKYLLNTQQADGGWGITEGAVSETDCTSSLRHRKCIVSFSKDYII